MENSFEEKINYNELNTKQNKKKIKVKLHKIILRNFKSFRKADIPIADGFTAIVGANGSGKSNILDAIMFVTGATSLKAMRVSKMAELVNHDAEDETARVELIIQDENKEEHNIVRRIDRSGKCIYALDEKRVTLSEVESFLANYNIRPDGHNIVAQGDITKIIDMSPKQRREIVDEVAGIKEYEEKKEEAMAKLIAVEKKINDVRIVIKERKKYMEQMQKERDAAIRYQELQQKLKDIKGTLLYREIKVLKEKMNEKQHKINHLERQLQSLREEKIKLIENENLLEKRNEEITKQIIDSKEKIYSSIGRNIEEKKAELKLNEEKIKLLQGEIQRNNAKVEEIRKKIEELNNIIKQKNDILDNNVQKIDKITALIKPIETKKEDKTKQLEKISTKLKDIEEMLKNIEKEIDNKKKKFYEKLLNEIKYDEAKIFEIDKMIKNAEDELIEKKTKVTAEKKEIEFIKKEIDKKTSGDQWKNYELVKISIRRCLENIEKIETEITKCDKTKNLNISKFSEIKKDLQEIRKLTEKISGEDILKDLNLVLENLTKSIEKTEKEISIALEKIQILENEKCLLKQKVSENRNKLGDFINNPHIEPEIKKLIEEKYSLKINEDNLKKMIEEYLTHEDIRKYEAYSKEIELLEKQNTNIMLWVNNANEKISELENELNIITKKSLELEEKLKLETEEHKNLSKTLDEKEKELEKSSASFKILEEERERVIGKMKKISEDIEKISREIEQKEKAINEINIESSKNEVRIMDLEEEFDKYKEAKIIEDTSLESLKKQLVETEKEITKIGAVNMRALENFDSIRKEIEEIEEKANKLEQEKNAIIELITRIENKKYQIFLNCFSKIAEKFSEFYYHFFNGEGFLELENPKNPFEGGLIISARYKGDKMKSIDAMSGGEKSLAALAFIFAIQSYDPAPFYILDEADAALDAENSVKFAKMITEKAKDTQFIVITHNDVIVKEADHIIGVGMNKQKSSVIGLKLREEAEKQTEKIEKNQMAQNGYANTVPS